MFQFDESPACIVTRAPKGLELISGLCFPLLSGHQLRNLDTEFGRRRVQNLDRQTASDFLTESILRLEHRLIRALFQSETQLGLAIGAGAETLLRNDRSKRPVLRIGKVIRLGGTRSPPIRLVGPG